MLSSLFQSLFIGLALSLGLIPLFIKLYKRFHIYDIRNARKIHIRAIPTMAGIPMFIAFTFAFLLSSSGEIDIASLFILSGLTLFSLLGVYDDLNEVRPTRKFLSQLAIALIIVYWGGVSIQSWYGLIPSFELNGLVALSVSVLFIAIVTNMYNLIDGLDGLAGTIGLVITGFFSLWFLYSGNYTFAILNASAFGVTVGFLFFNWSPAKIFMGDTGAMWIGALIAVSSIMFLNTNFVDVGDNLFFSGSIGTLLAILFIPVFDTVRVVCLRVIKGQGIFTADQNHTHYALIKSGLSHRQVSLLLGFVNIFTIGLALLLHELPDKYLIPIIILIALQVHFIIEFVLIRTEVLNNQTSDTISNDHIKPSKRSS